MWVWSGCLEGGEMTGSFVSYNRFDWALEEFLTEKNRWDLLQTLPTIPEGWMSLVSESSSNMWMDEEEETDLVSKDTNLFLKERWALEVFPSRKKGSLTNSRHLLPLVDAISSWCDGRRREGSFEDSKGKDSAKIFETFKVDEEVVYSDEGSPLAVAKCFLGFRDKDYDESLSCGFNV